ncbi:hypothetical protein ACHAXT_008285 [Thalassiosira profunda]
MTFTSPSLLAKLEAERTRLQNECTILFDKRKAIDIQMEEYQKRLMWLDDKIEGRGVGEGPTQPTQPDESLPAGTKVKFEVVDDDAKKKGKKRPMDTQPEEYLTDPHTQQQPEDYLTDPTQEQEVDHAHDNHDETSATDSTRRVSASPPSGVLDTNTPLGLHCSSSADPPGIGGSGRTNAGNSNPFGDLWNNNESANAPTRSNVRRGGPGGLNTLEKYFNPAQASSNNAVGSSGAASNGGQLQSNNFGMSGAIGAAQNSARYPWTESVMHHLKNTFGIAKFRGHQQEIINATLSGQDAFVVMRTGGGKSLTYQLPALIESEGRQSKVTVVISPLVSLIRDQEEQMNEISRGSATSFTSGMGNSEHARRWGLVRDPTAGIALIFVTPEKVAKSGKFKGEMEKLSEAGRLGRFVVDECHCACQWGHDFRPDYTKLNILRHHFPTTPILAVTATASERVRHDCVKILKLSQNYRFFRSTANRPNLNYSVQCKPDSKAGVIKEMVAFIKKNHAREAGIVYCFSKKECDDVAGALSEHGIVARSYHSGVADGRKDQIQRSWMRNKTQVVVATIAFGLGINKPDVRFVLHHSMAKSLEAYYQESGRAGRDGKPANCVLYYSPKDVPRMVGMIYGEAGEGTFWSMAKYAQAHGDDALCRHTILATLGEADNTMENTLDNLQKKCTTSALRDVGRHCQTVTKLVDALMTAKEECTLIQLVSKWRSKAEEANFSFLKANPPAKDLTKEECERIIIYLLYQDVLHPTIRYTAYNTLVYIGLGPKAPYLLTSPNPRAPVSFPVRKKGKKTSSAKASPLAVADDDKWVSRSAEAKKTKSTKKTKTTGKRKAKKAKGGKKATKKRASKSKLPKAPIEIVEIDDSSSSEDESSDDDNMVLARRASKGKKSRTVIAGDTSDEDSEFELSD